MVNKELWDKKVELSFFDDSKNFASIEQLFYQTEDNRYLAYWPKKYKGKKSTLQSRNALIGNFTEKWTTDLIRSIVKEKGLFAIQGAQCPEIGLSNSSPADVVISTKNKTKLKPDEIKVIFEVKMSLVWNWQFKENTIIEVGDFKTHQGQPDYYVQIQCLKLLVNVLIFEYLIINLHKFH